MNELSAAVFIYVPTGDPAVDASNRLLIAEHGYCFPQKIATGDSAQQTQREVKA